MSEKEHSPTPWIFKQSDLPGLRPIYIKTPGETFLCSMYHGECNPTEEKQKTNAAFIVSAVNAHDRLKKVNAALVEALEDMLKVHEMLLPGLKHISVADYKLVNDAPVDAHIALARGEEKDDA